MDKRKRSARIDAMHQVAIDAGKLSRHEFAATFDDVPSPMLAYMLAKQRSVIKRAEAAKRKSKKARATKKARIAKEEKEAKGSAKAIVGETSNNNFFVWYEEIKSAARDYLDRVNSGTAQFSIAGTGEMGPWQMIEVFDQQITAKLADAKPGDDVAVIYKEYVDNAKRMTSSITDLKLKKLEQELARAGIVALLCKRLVESGPCITFGALSTAVGLGVDAIRRLRKVYELVDQYNLLFYSRTSISKLDKWHAHFTMKLLLQPQEAAFWQGHGIASSKDYDTATHFTFDTRVFGYSQRNIEDRVANVAKMNDPHFVPESANVDLDIPDADDGDDDDEELI